MEPFRFDASPDPIRSDLQEAYRRAWAHIAGPGTWLTGSERVAIAGETRRARSCDLCAERKAALSPFSVGKEHTATPNLSVPLLDLVHRVTTDAARLSEKWYRGLLQQGLTPDAYVEALGVTVITISIDRFHHALGLPLEPLPDPQPGEPTRVRPENVVETEAWVPMQASRAITRLVGLPPGPAPYVLRALSLVPAELKAWMGVGAAQYLGPQDMLRFDQTRAIDRSQIELVAGRVSALNECFY